MDIRDIARLSGVGVSTVSTVLNNHQDVKESTREKVMQVIKDSNYVPNNSARILKQNSTNNIAVSITIIVLLIKYFFITSPIKLYNK